VQNFEKYAKKNLCKKFQFDREKRENPFKGMQAQLLFLEHDARHAWRASALKIYRAAVRARVRAQHALEAARLAKRYFIALRNIFNTIKYIRRTLK